MNDLSSIRASQAVRFTGWLFHDGRGMPVPPDGLPGVAFRNGWRVAPSCYLARHWVGIGWDSWCHSGGPLDIVAFLPSYGLRPVTPWHSEVCAMIRDRYPCETDTWINERLADDLIALFATRRTCRKGQSLSQFPDTLLLRQV